MDIQRIGHWSPVNKGLEITLHNGTKERFAISPDSQYAKALRTPFSAGSLLNKPDLNERLKRMQDEGLIFSYVLAYREKQALKRVLVLTSENNVSFDTIVSRAQKNCASISSSSIPLSLFPPIYDNEYITTRLISASDLQNSAVSPLFSLYVQMRYKENLLEPILKPVAKAWQRLYDSSLVRLVRCSISKAFAFIAWAFSPVNKYILMPFYQKAVLPTGNFVWTQLAQLRLAIKQRLTSASLSRTSE